jgi:hypothetical protein
MNKFLGAAGAVALFHLLSFPLAAGERIYTAGSASECSALFTLDSAAAQMKKDTPYPASAKPPAAPEDHKIAASAPLSGREKWRFYLRSTYGPVSVGSSLILAGIKQAQPDVPEWGGGMQGYGKRFGSSFGQNAINRSIRMALNGLFREDPRYLPSGGSGYFHRSLDAVHQEFWVRKDSGGSRIAFSRFAGIFGAACIATRWSPESYRTASVCLTSGMISLGLDTAKNVFYEFWPDVRKRLHH